MKKYILTLMLLFAGLSALHSQTPAPPVDLDYSVDDPSTDAHRGRRTRPAPIMVVVDIEAGTITGTSALLDGIVRYEIWDADGNLCIASASDAATVLKAINGCHGTYLLRLRGDGYTLAGYLVL